jgi:hypothetical protein
MRNGGLNLIPYYQSIGRSDVPTLDFLGVSFHETPPIGASGGAPVTGPLVGQTSAGALPASSGSLGSQASGLAVSGASGLSGSSGSGSAGLLLGNDHWSPSRQGFWAVADGVSYHGLDSFRAATSQEVGKDGQPLGHWGIPWLLDLVSTSGNQGVPEDELADEATASPGFLADKTAVM